jgi:hypothetical protein
MGVVTLRCKEGNHDWEHPSKRGRYPENCPEHVASPSSKRKKTPVSAMQAGRVRKAQESRRKLIAEITDHPKAISCHCPITSDSTDDELRRMKSCGDPYFVCATLDAVRRAVGV